MYTRTRLAVSAALAALVLGLGSWTTAQTHGVPERFTAVAVANNNIATGAGTALINVDRWTTDAERNRLVEVLMKEGPRELLDELTDIRSVGRIRTPDSLGYDLHYAHQTPTGDGGRRIVLMTDRPIGFWEQWYRPRTVDYPFTVIQMQFGPEGKGKGTLSYATKMLAHDNIIELEDFASSPVMLNEIVAEEVRD
jgi:hypothetical protein